jgi:hypothetical protein
MKRAIFPIVILTVFILSACTLPFTITWNTPTEQTSAPALPAETTAPVVVITATPETPTQISGFETNQGGVYMIVPPCLGTGATGMIMSASDPGDEGPYYAAYPEHRLISIQGYPVTNNIFKPEVKVYPVAEFLALDQNNFIGSQISNLQAILNAQSIPATGSLPFVYASGAQQVFRAQTSIITFQNGQGIGYMTEYAQYYVPVNNADLFYTFQGLTSDGKYLISATFPINASFLQNTPDQNAVVPPGGIVQPVPGVASEAELTAYYDNMVALLNATSADQFNPSLACIVSYIQTLNITN